MHNQEFLNEMLHLTADIAEELLTLKDTGNELSDATTEKIARLAELAISCRIPTTEQTTGTPLTQERELLSGNTSTSVLTRDHVETHSQSISKPCPEPEAAVDIENTEKEALNEEENTEIVGDNLDEIQSYHNSAVKENIPDKRPDIGVESSHHSQIYPAKSKLSIESNNIYHTNTQPEVRESIQPKIRQFSARELRNAFTLNDVFLFQRTLFHGSSIEFKQALEEIASLSDVRELEEYLISVHGIDLTSPEAEDFINIVRTFF